MDWIDLDEAVDRALRSGASEEALGDILRSGRVGISAVLVSAPSDKFHVLRLRRTPSHIEEVLTRALSQFRFDFGNRLQVVISWYSERELQEAAVRFAETGRKIALGADTCVFGEVRVHWPTLTEELAAAGFTTTDTTPGDPLDARTAPRRRGAYKGELAAFMKRHKPEWLATFTDEEIAQRFADRINAKIQAGRSALKLPQLRNVANQVAKLREQIPGCSKRNSK